MALENRIVRNPAGKSHVWKHFGFFSSEDGTPVKDKVVCRLCLSEVLYCKISCAFGTTPSKRTDMHYC